MFAHTIAQINIIYVVVTLKKGPAGWYGDLTFSFNSPYDKGFLSHALPQRNGSFV